MKVFAETFLIQKQGCTREEQEDAAWAVERCEDEQILAIKAPTWF